MPVRDRAMARGEATQGTWMAWRMPSPTSAPKIWPPTNCGVKGRKEQKAAGPVWLTRGPEPVAAAAPT